MTTCEDAAAPACRCVFCGAADLPVNPFEALRVAYGMLLGEDEFRTMLGNPRGKQMLHNAWLHRAGVVWGYRVSAPGTKQLQVSPGLAVDGLGREVVSDVTVTLNVQDWLADNPAADDADAPSGTRTLRAHLVATFACCPTSPVPTLADPCDVTRKHDNFSRVVETATVELRPGRRPRRIGAYHRLRVLLGLDEVRDDDDEAGRQAQTERRSVAEAEPDLRARQLLHAFRALAAADAAELDPAAQPGPDARHDTPTAFPVDEPDADVVLADVDIELWAGDGHVVVIDVRAEIDARTTLLPTSTIQELACGLAPGLLAEAADDGSGAPQVVADSLGWSEDGRRWSFAVTAALVPGSVRRAIRMTSLSARGWVDEDIDAVRYDPGMPGIVIDLADRPVNDLVRIVVHGTGSTPVFGADPPLPLAGVVGRPPAPADDGRDAVLTVANPLLDRRNET